MAALTLVAGLGLSLVAALGVPSRAEEKLVVNKVQLDLTIAGLSTRGCDVEVKPGSAGCNFPTDPRPRHVDARGRATIILKDVEIRSADRDCSFAITIREDGQAERTLHRGFRLPTPTAGQPAPVPTFVCYLNAPSKLARVEAERTRR